MATNIVVPDLGESVVEATVLRWLKQAGEPVSAGETLVELETEKVNLEVSAPKAGVLARIEHQPGEDVKIGDVLGVIEDKATESAAAPASNQRPPATEAVAPPTGNQRPPATEAEAKPEPAVQATPAAETKATPVAERMAQEYGVPLSQVTAGGADGRITKQDIENYLAKQ